ncbi:MAG: methyltransferase, partial [Candidatus Aminicenantales bacterium]
LEKTAEWLAPAGRACFVYPEKRRPDLLAAAGESGLSAVRLRSILPREGEPPNLFLIELEHAARQPELMPALILFGEDGKYTPEAEAVFAGP